MAVHTASVVRAQFIVDGTTNIFSEHTNSFPGDVTVGSSSSSFSLLVISNNALLGNALNSFIGATGQTRFFRVFKP